jgi:hypothetical protein
MVRTESQIRAAVKEFVRALEPRAHVQQIILYGSYAKGQAREESDIDIAVLSDDFARMSELEVIQVLAHQRIYCDSMLMPVGYTPAQFGDPDNAFAREIARTGKIIYRAPRQRAKPARRSKGNGRRATAKRVAAG